MLSERRYDHFLTAHLMCSLLRRQPMSPQLGNGFFDFVHLVIVCKQPDHRFLLKCTPMCRVIYINVVVKAKEVNGGDPGISAQDRRPRLHD